MKLDCLIPAIFAMSSILHAAPQGEVSYVADPKLGDPFQVLFYDAGDSSQYRATLIRYAGSFEQENGSKPEAKAVVFYIHGFNDYFFQKELAQKADSAGYAFYAIDLHKYGRSYREGERLGEVYDLAEYYPELDSAIARIKTETKAPIVLLGHSTGGLIASVYAADRGNGKDFAAIVLNSPFMDMNTNFLLELAVPLVSKIGSIFPNIEVPRTANSCYSESIHKNYGGLWDYDFSLKNFESIPINLGWLRAIHQGHVAVQKGMDLIPPILVMHSGCSERSDECVETYSRCDGVLDVEDIDRYGRKLGRNVQMQVIENGLHDLYLSHEPARGNAYQATFQFLDDVLPKEVH